MKTYERFHRGRWKKIGVFAVIATVSFGMPAEGFLGMQMPGKIVQLYGAEDMLGYQNPKKIVITTPNTNNYSTTASKISVLGACDYRYPLTMNGEPVETTEHGFFTVYVTLSVGKNVFTFKNGEHSYQLTVTRKKATGGSSSGGGTTAKYKAVNNKMGELILPYTMPYSAPGKEQIDYHPLTINTTFRIVGEQGSYYKLPDGTFVPKSAVRVYNYAMPANKVNSAKVTYNQTTHTVETAFSMKMDALYDVQINGNTVKFILYDTTAGGSVSVPENPLVKSIARKTDGEKRAIYTYSLKNGDKLCGYDVTTKNGKMTFSLKYAPVLKQKGSLDGAVILLDAGHGGSDNGASGPVGTLGPTEKKINLDLTLKIKKALEEMGAKVVLTRGGDKYYSLNERVEAIRNLKPDLSISIHGNAMGITSDYSMSAGFLTFYSYNQIQDAAGIINSAVNRAMGYSDRNIRKANLSLTRLTACPAVLLESAFLTNPQDYENLLKSSNRQKLANAIAGASKEYLEAVADYEKTEVTYTIKKGDTLSAIARKHGVTVDAIAKRNKIQNVNIIRTGDVLVIPVK